MKGKTEHARNCARFRGDMKPGARSPSGQHSHNPPSRPGSEPKPGSSSYHKPKSVDDLTGKNVRTIAELECAAQRDKTLSDRMATSISRFCGSMAFVWVHVVFFTVWIVWNTALPLPQLDPYPFSFLTLVVSLEAIFLSTFIMISENRQEHVNARRNQLDLQINLLAEQENTKLLSLLEKIALKLEVDPSEDPDVEVLEEATRPEQLMKQIEKVDEELASSEKETSQGK